MFRYYLLIFAFSLFVKNDNENKLLTVNGEFYIKNSEIIINIYNNNSMPVYIYNAKSNNDYFFKLNIYNIDKTKVWVDYPRVSYSWSDWKRNDPRLKLYISKYKIRKGNSKNIKLNKTGIFITYLNPDMEYLIGLDYYCKDNNWFDENSDVSNVKFEKLLKVSYEELDAILIKMYGDLFENKFKS